MKPTPPATAASTDAPRKLLLLEGHHNGPLRLVDIHGTAHLVSGSGLHRLRESLHSDTFVLVGEAPPDGADALALTAQTHSTYECTPAHWGVDVDSAVPVSGLLELDFVPLGECGIETEEEAKRAVGSRDDVIVGPNGTAARVSRSEMVRVAAHVYWERCSLSNTAGAVDGIQGTSDTSSAGDSNSNSSAGGNDTRGTRNSHTSVKTDMTSVNTNTTLNSIRPDTLASADGSRECTASPIVRLLAKCPFVRRWALETFKGTWLDVGYHVLRASEEEGNGTEGVAERWERLGVEEADMEGLERLVRDGTVTDGRPGW